MNKLFVFLVLFSFLLHGQEVKKDTVFILYEKEKLEGVFFENCRNLILKKYLMNAFPNLLREDYFKKANKYNYTADSIKYLVNYFKNKDKHINRIIGLECRVYVNNSDGYREEDRINWNTMSIVHREVELNNIEVYSNYYKLDNLIRKTGNTGGFLDYNNLGGMIIDNEDLTFYKTIQLSDYLREYEGAGFIHFEALTFWRDIKDYDAMYLESEPVGEGKTLFKKVTLQFHGLYIY